MKRAPILRLAVLLAVISFVSGAAPGAQVKAPTMRGYPAVGAPPTIKVLDRGAAPRTPLRYVIPAGQKARMVVTISGSMVARIGALVEPLSVPTMKMAVDLAVSSVASNGDMAYDLAIVDFTMEGGDVNPANPTLRRIMDVIATSKGSARVSNVGVATTTLVVDPQLKATVAQWTSSLENLWTPFPEDAVGLGARWEVRQATKAMGGLTAVFDPTVFRRTEYELVSIDGSTLSLRMTSEETGPPQVARNDLSGVQMNIQKLTGAAIGTATVDLKSLLPRTEFTSTTQSSGSLGNSPLNGAGTFYGRAKVAMAPPNLATPPDALIDLKPLRGITAINLGGTGTSTVGPGRVCYPRPADDRRGNFAGVSIAMDGLLEAAGVVLRAGELAVTGQSTDVLTIDAQVWDAATCKATITLELHRGRGTPSSTFANNGNVVTGYVPNPVIWRRTFELSGVPAGFSARVADRLKLDVLAFVHDVTRAGASRLPES